MDVEYVRTWSLWNDAKILFKAIPVVFGGGGAY
jgi:lipopolysaccharide/colanic/teichoic acid biosynthesis glycosyltransferase